MARKAPSQLKTLHRANDTLRVFISYSRRDAGAADLLVEDLEARGFEVVIDRRDLPYGEQWQVELADFIRGADTVVWLVSPASAASTWVNWELGEVQRANKRLIPVRLAETPVEALPPAVGRVHMLPAEGVFERGMHGETLAAALESDRAWLKQHSRLADRAGEWKSRGAGADRLLRGAALRDAEDWRKRQPPKAPPPSADVLELLAASERAGRSRARVTVLLSSSIALVSIGLAAASAWQYLQAEEARAEATQQRDEALRNESKMIAEQARALVGQGDALKALQKVRTALPKALNAPDRPVSTEALQVLTNALYRLWESPVTLRELETDRTVLLQTSPNGRLLIFNDGSGATALDIETNRVLWTHDGGMTNDRLVWSPRHDRLAFRDSFGKEVLIFDLASGASSSIESPSCDGNWGECFISGFSWSADGSAFALVDTENVITVWDTATLRQISALGPFCPEGMRPERCRVLKAEWSLDSGHFVSLDAQQILRLWTWPMENNSNPLIIEGVDAFRAAPDENGILIHDLNKTFIRLSGPGLERSPINDHLFDAIPSPDGKRFALSNWNGDKSSITITDFERPPLVVDIDPVFGPKLFWSPDGAIIAVVDEEGDLLVIDATTGQTILFREGEFSAVEAFAWMGSNAFAVFISHSEGMNRGWVKFMKLERDQSALLRAADEVLANQ